MERRIRKQHHPDIRNTEEGGDEHAGDDGKLHRRRTPLILCKIGDGLSPIPHLTRTFSLRVSLLVIILPPYVPAAVTVT